MLGAEFWIIGHYPEKTKPKGLRAGPESKNFDFWLLSLAGLLHKWATLLIPSSWSWCAPSEQLGSWQFDRGVCMDLLLKIKCYWTQSLDLYFMQIFILDASLLGTVGLEKCQFSTWGSGFLFFMVRPLKSQSRNILFTTKGPKMHPRASWEVLILLHTYFSFLIAFSGLLNAQKMLVYLIFLMCDVPLHST